MSAENNLLGVVIAWESLDHLDLIHLRVIYAFPSLTFGLSQALWSQIHCR